MMWTANWKGPLAHALPLALLASSLNPGQAKPDYGSALNDNEFRSEQSVRSMFPDSEFTIDFDEVDSFEGGTLQFADLESDPVLGSLTSGGLVQVIVEFEPCGIIIPHTHPRADEVYFMVSGSIDIGFVDENDKLIRNAGLKRGKSFVVPQGYLHYVSNPNCEPATSLATLPSPDQGFTNAVLGPLVLPPYVLQAFLPTLETDRIGRFKDAIAAGGIMVADPACVALCAAREGSTKASRDNVMKRSK